MNAIRFFFTFLIIFIAMGLSGCTTKSTHQGAESFAAGKPVMADYYLQPGDNLDIKFFYSPDLNENVTIRPDGRISLQLIDEVFAAGLTPKQLDDILTEKYSKELKNPILAVIVRSFEGQRIYVGGEVRNPQVLTVTGRINAIQAIFHAGGPTLDAKLSSAVIVRKGPDNRPVAKKVDLEKALQGTIQEEDYLLMPYDMIYIPKTSIAGLDQFLTHIYHFIPPQIGLGFSYEIHADEPN